MEQMPSKTCCPCEQALSIAVVRLQSLCAANAEDPQHRPTIHMHIWLLLTLMSIQQNPRAANGCLLAPCPSAWKLQQEYR